MKSIFKQFRKQGGIKLIKYWKNHHVLMYSLLLLPFLFASKTGQEEFREAVSNKIQKKYTKKYSRLMVNEKELFAKSVGQPNGIVFKKRPIWFCWLQGLNQAPEIVQFNYANLISKFGENRVHLVSSDNVLEFIQLPDYIINKWKNGIISNTHFSDIIRLQLLVQNGGIWIDSTVLVSCKELPNYLFDDIFFFQTLKPGRNGLALPLSNWIISSKPNEIIIKRTRNLLLYFWKNTDKLDDYFIFHRLLSVSMNQFPDELSKMTLVDNSQPHSLLIMSRNYKLKISEMLNIVSLCSFHKLTNKFENENQRENLLKLINFLGNNSFFHQK